MPSEILCPRHHTSVKWNRSFQGLGPQGSLRPAALRLRTALASLHRTPDWDKSTGVPGPHALVDGRRPGDEALRVPALLQRVSRPCGVGRATARHRFRMRACSREPQFVPLAAAIVAGSITRRSRREVWGPGMWVEWRGGDEAAALSSFPGEPRGVALLRLATDRLRAMASRRARYPLEAEACS